MHQTRETDGFRGDTDRTVIVPFHGDLDLYVAPEVKQELLAAIDGGAQRIVVDLRDVSFIDSTILGVLLSAAKRLRSVEGEVAIVCTKPSIRTLFEVTLLDKVFCIYDEPPQSAALWN